MHYVESSPTPGSSDPPPARVWEGRVESTAQRLADLVQALRGAERERLIVTVEERAGGGGGGGGVDGGRLELSVKQKTACVGVL